MKCVETLRCISKECNAVNWQHRVNSFSVLKLGHFHCRTKGSTPRPAVFHAIYNRDVGTTSERKSLLRNYSPPRCASPQCVIRYEHSVPTKIVTRECNFEDVSTSICYWIFNLSFPNHLLRIRAVTFDDNFENLRSCNSKDSRFEVLAIEVLTKSEVSKLVLKVWIPSKLQIFFKVVEN